jgi:rhodanese-related sulfurtransferase
MKSKLFAMLLLAATPAFVGCGGGGIVSSINGADAHALVAAGATLLDVRTSMEWDGGHLEGAVLIPVGELQARMAEVPRDHPVVVYCASGSRSARAASMLSSAGYDARDLGEMGNWSR